MLTNPFDTILGPKGPYLGPLIAVGLHTDSLQAQLKAANQNGFPPGSDENDELRRIMGKIVCSGYC